MTNYLKPNLLFLAIFLFQFVRAQTNNSPSSSNPLNPYLNNYVQPPPNAAALGKYADYPVGYYTGVPNISIPIYDLKDNGIELPISLSYHSSGIKVSELASWVGLGWALNAGGVINRAVRGAPDEGSRKSSYSPSGYYKDHGMLNMNYALPYPLPGSNNLSDPQGLFYNGTVNGILSGGSDTEPDLFTFNFNGHTGKFVFDEKGVPRLLEDDNLKITVGWNGSNNFNYFVITTDDGIKYYFGEGNAFEIVRPRNVNGSEDANDAAPSSWYLTRMYNPNTKETATFNYVQEGYSYYDLGPESMLYGSPGGIESTVNYTSDNSQINSHTYVDNFITTMVQGIKLSSIVTNNYTVSFYANTLRQDLDKTDNSFKDRAGNNITVTHDDPNSLDAIKIYTNKDNVCIKQFSLDHNYFISDNATAQVVINSAGNNAPDTKRLKLTAVTETSGDGSIEKPSYQFTYQESIKLPRRLSYDQDHWGYSNNSAGTVNSNINYNNYFTPPVTCYYSTYSGGADRKPKWPDMSGFTLTSIQDPLGASTTFNFGANSTNNAPLIDGNSTPADTLVGGLRIEQIKVKDNVTGTEKVRSFGYKNPNNSQPGGVLIHTPIYLIRIFSEYFQNLSMGGSLQANMGYYGNGTSSSFGQDGDGSQYLKQSQSIVPMQDASGNHIVYPDVKEVFGLNAIGGYKKYHFNVNSLSPSNGTLNSKLDFSAYAYDSPVQENLQGTTINGKFGNGQFNDTISYPGILPIGLAQHYCRNYPGIGINAYPFAPDQVDLVSSKLGEEDTYDSSGNLLEAVTNTYTTNFHENFWIRGLKAYIQNLVVNFTENGQNYHDIPSGFNALTFYKLHTGISHLSSTTKKTYTGSNYVTEVTNFNYDSPAHTLKTSESTTDSQGNTFLTKTYYSFDYSNSATGDNIFGKMKARNLLLPVNKTTWKNNNLVSGTITQYKDVAASSADTLINPGTIYSLETASPLTASQANMTTGYSGPLSTLNPSTTYFIPKIGFTYDGTTGKLINQQRTYDKSQGVEWSSKLNLPVTVIDNAQNTPAAKEFYYEGFETSTSDNVYSSVPGHTGRKSFSTPTPYTISWAPPNNRNYVYTYWYSTPDGWRQQAEQAYTGSFTLPINTLIDDIRIYPKDANMVNYTYDNNGNLTSSMDAKGLTTYYYYDGLQRLVTIRDKDLNVIKSFCYDYGNTQDGCAVDLTNKTITY